MAATTNQAIKEAIETAKNKVNRLWKGLALLLFFLKM
jgi:hypothetical protein